MKKYPILLFTLVAILWSCRYRTDRGTLEAVEEINEIRILDNKVLTADEQARLTPYEVLDILTRGNEDFINDDLTVRNNTDRVREASPGQFPKAVVLSCLDSRVPVEDIFHRGIGDIFVVRIAGNIVNGDILGSLEYACKVSGAKAVIVMGHDHCGAITSAIKDTQLGNITSLLDKIKPAIAKVSDFWEGEPSAHDRGYVDAVCTANVRHSISQIRSQSPILAEMEQNGEIIIKGAKYDMDTGKVDFLED